LQLREISEADEPAMIIASQRITEPGQAPIGFRLFYDASAIDPRKRYALSARIEQNASLLFINNTAAPVLTHGHGNSADLLRVRGTGPGPPSGPAPRLSGMLGYRSGVAEFEDCRNGRSFKVAQEAGFPTLAQVYLAARGSADDEIRVDLRGRYLERAGREANRTEVQLVVETVEAVHAGRCEPATHAHLTDTWWRLRQLETGPVHLSTQQREPHMVLESATDRVRGHGGCNPFSGSYQQASDRLTFSSIGATRKNCPTAMAVETTLLAALSMTERFQIRGEILELWAGAQLLARFESVYH
jgi:heat shock protein HslJ